MDKIQLRNLLLTLREVQKETKNVFFDPGFGICCNVFLCGNVWVQNNFTDWLRENSNRWPKFSWNYGYPIKSPYSKSSDKKDDVVTDARTFYLIANKWDNDEYGNSRREFLSWCIEQIEQQLENK